ncbi:MAG: DUF2188 domain-containing protein [Candidatus Nitrotoga sp.]|nr:DUF2188 domain-containing protein [Candidatus Nitrotoga sp.]
MTKSHHVIPNPKGGWDIKVGGGEKAIKHFETKQPAIDIAREISRNQGSELLIHNKKGIIGQKDSHGNDPKKVKG